MKGAGMLVFSLRGVNFGFWSHLGCSGENTIIFSRQDLHAKKYNINVFFFNLFYLLDSNNQSFL